MANRINYEKLIELLPNNQKEALVRACELLADGLKQPGQDSDYLMATAFVERLAQRAGVSFPKFDASSAPRDKFNSLTTNIITRRADILKDLYAEEVDELFSRLEHKSKHGRFGYAHLTADEKAEIHSKLHAIKGLVEASTLGDGKKNAILSRIAALSREVDLEGTKTDRFFSFLGDFVFVTAELHEDAEPIIADTKDILRIIMDRRAEDEQVQLPPQEKLPQLPSPRSREGKK